MPLTPSEEDFLLTLARRIVPETGAFTMADRLAFLGCVRAAQRARPDALTRRLGLFLWVLRARRACAGSARSAQADPGGEEYSRSQDERR